MTSRAFRLFKASIKSEATLNVYKYSLDEFIRFSKIQDYDSLLKLNRKKIQKLLEDWVISLANKGLKAHSIRSKLNGVELFMEMNKIFFHKKILHKLIPSNDYILGGGVPFTTEEIQRMLSSTTKLRTKAVIHFLASTGPRPSCITDPILKMKHLCEMPNACKGVRLYDDSNEGYWAFLTPEATEALNTYLNSRRLNGEELTTESPVFTNLEKDTWGKKNKHLSSQSLGQLVANILVTAGIERKKDGKRYDKALTYGFRKRFNGILKMNNEVNWNIAEKLMGHKIGLDSTYFKPTREECFAEFLKVVPKLTISDDARNKFKITELEKEKSQIDQLKGDVSKLKVSLEKQIQTRTTIGAFYERGETKGLKDVDPNMMELLEFWEALKASGKIPDSFKYSKEKLDVIKKVHPKYFDHILLGKKKVLQN